MTRRHTLMMTTLTATLLSSIALSPAMADPAPEVALDPIEFNIFAPSGGAGYQFLPGTSCAHGEPCVFVPRYGSVSYTFRPTQRADFYDYRAGGNSGTSCSYHLEVDVWGIPMHLPASGGCPLQPWPAWRARLEAPTWEYGRVGESVLTIACQDQPCTYELDSLIIEPGYRRLALDPIEYTPWMDLSPLRLPADTSMESCIRVRASGSNHYPVDYFRIAWGDGKQTYDAFAIPFPENKVERKYCHAYPPSPTLEYQICVTAHDKLDRLERVCTDVEAPIETL